MKTLLSLTLLLVSCLNYALAQETVIVDEQFIDNSNNWYTGESKDYQMTVNNGVYRIESKSSDPYWIKKDFSFDGDKEDFTIEAAISQPTGAAEKPKKLKDKLKALKSTVQKKSDGVLGLVWAIYADESDYHRFLISSEGSFYLGNYYNSESHPYVTWTASEYIKGPGETNILRVEKKANITTFMINGHIVHKSGNISQIGSKIGFHAEKKIIAEINSLRVTTSKTVIPTVANARQGNQKEALSSNVNSEYNEVGGVISPDGNHLYIGRKYDPNNKGYGVKEEDIDIWYSAKSGENNWTKAINMGYPLSNEGHNWVISVSPDNNTLLLSNTYAQDGSSDGPGLSISTKKSTGWSVPSKLRVEGLYNDSDYVDYCLGPNKRVLILSIENKDTHGQRDLYVSFLTDDGSWTKPKNMGNTLNSFGDEESPFLAADNKTLYFGTEGHPGFGSNDIFISRRLDDTWTNWSQPLNIGPDVNTKKFEASFLLSAKGDYAYFVSSSDIYRIKMSEAAKPEPVVLVSGIVYNSKTDETLSADIKYFDLTENVILGSAISDPSDGAFKIALPKGKLYGFLAEKDGYYAVSENLDLRELESYAEIKKDLYLSPIIKGETIRLNSVFFEFNKADLKTESFNELDRLYDILVKSPQLKIEIGGHTDDKGTEQYNLNLSKSRAESVKAYLVDKGISESQLTSRGYGESQPVVTNDSEENRAYNRRVEFRIL